MGDYTGKERQARYMQRLREGAKLAPRVPDELLDALAKIDLERFWGDDAVAFAERAVAISQRMLANANKIAARRQAVSDGVRRRVRKRLAPAGKPKKAKPA